MKHQEIIILEDLPTSKSPQYLPEFVYDTTFSTDLETSVQSPVRCQLVSEADETDGLAELVVMDTGIQASACEEHVFVEL